MTDNKQFNNHPTWKLVVVNGNLVWQRVKYIPVVVLGTRMFHFLL